MRFDIYKLNRLLLYILFTLAIVSCETNQLKSNQTLFRGEALVSKNRRCKLILEQNGNLVLYKGFNIPIWSTNTSGSPVERCVMQEDGNLVLYDGMNNPYWSSATDNYKGAKLLLQDDFDLGLIHNGEIIWNALKVKSILKTNQELKVSDSLVSPNKKFKLVMQEDGNLVLYKKNSGPIWSSNTFGKPVTKCVLQKDGNLVLYDNSSNVQWATNTSNNFNCILTLNDNGRLILSTKEKTIWSSGQ